MYSRWPPQAFTYLLPFHSLPCASSCISRSELLAMPTDAMQQRATPLLHKLLAGSQARRTTLNPGRRACDPASRLEHHAGSQALQKPGLCQLQSMGA